MENKSSKFGGDVKNQFWLEPTAAALAKLEEIQSSVESMRPASAFNVQSVWHPSDSTPTPSALVVPERSASSSKAAAYTELETEPPLSTVSFQKTAWGSNTSIPDLIKAQGERQKQKGAPRRPWSGRKVPPSPTLQRKGSQNGGTNDTSKDAPGAFISVKGAKSVMYEPSSRPPSGRPHQSSSSSSSAASPAAPHASSYDVFEMMEAANTLKSAHGESATQGEDNALEEFLRSQPNGHKHELSKLSAAYADERNITPPPPPPCASPDLEKLINGSLEEEEEKEDNFYAEGELSEVEGQNQEENKDTGELYIKKPSYVPPQLLRRPTPEPLKLSMTIPDAEGEEEYSTDEDRSSGAPSPQLSPDIEVQSITSEVSAQLAQYITSQQSSPDQSQPVTPQGVDSTIAQYRGESDHDRTEVNIEKPRRGRQSVKFVEERNVTFDITPRDRSLTHKPSPPSISKAQRPRSALKNTGVRKSIVQKKRPSSASSISTRQSAKGNSYSSEYIGRDHDSDGSCEEDNEEQNISNNDIMDAINNNGMSQLLDNLSRSRGRKEVETMMSQLDVADEGSKTTPDASKEVPQSNIVRTVQVSSSSTKQNYYEKAIQAKKKSMYQRQNPPAQKLTTKVIEFGEDGPSMETKEVSYFQVTTPPSQVKVSRPSSSRGPRRGWEETCGADGTHVNRPTMEKKSFSEHQITRPGSRLGSYRDVESSDLLEVDKTSSQSRALQRARPRSAVLKSKREVSPHRCAGSKSPNRTKPRPHSSFVNSNTPKHKPVRRSSSPSAQTYSNSNRALVPTVHKSKAEIQRNREAVRALKDGSLKKTKTYGKQIVAVDSRPSPGRALTSKNRQDGDKGSDSDSIDEYPKSMREEEVFDLHRHLTRSGVKVSYNTLKRGLVAPDEKNIKQCLDQLPSNVSLNLLSKPEAWLGETYQKYQIAENALRRAETQIAIQEEKARLEAEKLKESLKGASGKRKKKKKGVKKRTKSPASSRSCVSSAKSGSSSILSRSKVTEGDRPISAISALELDPEDLLKETV